MKRFLLAAILALLAPAQAWATWSIIAVDRNTGRVVIASATCAANAPDQLKLLQAIVIPGVGVAAAQAGVDGTHANQKLIFEQMRRGTDPAAIMRMLEEDPALERRQFAILDLQGRWAGRTGGTNNAVALHVQGETPGGIVWSVQGNIIASEEALLEGGRIMDEDGLELVDRVMRAMDRVSALGGDRRCTCENVTEELADRPCNGRTSSTAYILAADAADARGAWSETHPQIAGRAEGDPAIHLGAPWNDGDYFLYLAVYPSGTRPEEDANPVLNLRRRYDAWRAAGSPRHNAAAARPNLSVRPPG